MTLGPDTPQSMGMSPVGRTILFWVMMIALAVVLWQMASRPSNGKSSPQMSYSEFMSQGDNNNVSTAELFDQKDTSEIDGQLRQPSEKFRVTIPKEVIPDLTERLRKQGVVIRVSSSSRPSWEELTLNLAPFIVIVGIWAMMMRQMKAKREQATMGGPSNRPIQ